jgi:hypothetical protein
MAGGQMRFKVLPAPPDLDHREVVQTIRIAQHLKANGALVVAAVGGELMQHLGGFRGAIWPQHVHVRDNIEPLVNVLRPRWIAESDEDASGRKRDSDCKFFVNEKHRSSYYTRCIIDSMKMAGLAVGFPAGDELAGKRVANVRKFFGNGRNVSRVSSS